jgi:anti-sigma factor RsiW
MNGEKRAFDPVVEWLGAYQDGALSDERRAWVEEHLRGCPACRQELDALSALSNLLQAEPAMTSRLSATEAARVITGRLPRAHGIERTAASLGRLARMAPLALFGVWAFIQAVLTLSGALFLAEQFFPGMVGVLMPLEFAAPLKVLLDWTLNMILPVRLIDLPLALSAALLPLLELAASALVAVLFAAWMAGVYSYRRARALAAGMEEQGQ